MSDYIKYGDVIIEINKTAGGHAFKCPLEGCGKEEDVRGDIGHCKNRVHQHLHLEHKLSEQKILDWPPKPSDGAKPRAEDASAENDSIDGLNDS